MMFPARILMIQDDGKYIEKQLAEHSTALL